MQKPVIILSSVSLCAAHCQTDRHLVIASELTMTHSHLSCTWRVVQLHVTERQSIPNLTAEASEGGSLPALIEFDSLKSLPQRDYLQPHYESQQQTSGIRLHLFSATMSWLAMPQGSSAD